MSNDILMICGGSDVTTSIYKELKNTSFGEIICQSLGWELKNVSRSGCSNGAVRLQIEEVLRVRPKLAIINPAPHTRIEIPASPDVYTKHRENPKGWNSDLDIFLKSNRTKEGYDPKLGINNINYANDLPYRMISEPIVMLAENETPQRPEQIPFFLSKDVRNAVKNYINFLYDSNWKKQVDQWIIREGIFQLYLHNIPFLLSCGSLWEHQDLRIHIPDVISDKYLITKYEETTTYTIEAYPYVDIDPGYHTSPEGQKYLANIYLHKIKKILN